MAERFHFFWSGPFSQWHPCTVHLWDADFNTAEQAMIVAKARLFGDEHVATEILKATHPGKQKALGRKVRGFEEAIWDDKKIEIVTEINLAKFDQNKGLRRKLFQTGDALMIEASPVDTVWGIGLSAEQAKQIPPDQWPGQNLLGKVLTDVKQTLRSRYSDEAVQT